MNYFKNGKIYGVTADIENREERKKRSYLDKKVRGSPTALHCQLIQYT